MRGVLNTCSTTRFAIRLCWELETGNAKGSDGGIPSNNTAAILGEQRMSQSNSRDLNERATMRRQSKALPVKVSGKLMGKHTTRKRAARVPINDAPNSIVERKVKSHHKCVDNLTTSIAGTSEEVVEVLYGRENEMMAIESQLEKCVRSSSSVSMYISGPPGTGKTASVNAVLRTLSAKYGLIVIRVNCVSVNTESALLRTMRDKLPGSLRNGTDSILRDSVEDSLQKADCPVILVLDEIDYIRTKNRTILYTTFQWPSKYSSLAVIAISNSLDFTERELPKLKLANPPIVLSFAPYSKEDLHRILKNKLSLKSGIDERAIELCSRKVAAMTGDVRHAMQIAHQILPNVSISPKNCSKEVGLSSRSACPQVLGAITNIYRPSLVRTRIPLQQKVLLAIMLRLADEHKNTILEKDVVLNAYERVCSIMSLPVADAGGANTAFSLLESLSVIKWDTNKCQLLVDVPTAIGYVADSALLAQINDLALN